QPDRTTTGEAQPCRCLHTSTHSSTSTSVRPTCIRCDGKIGHSSVPGARARTSIPGGSTTTAPAANAPGVTAASAPSTTSPRPLAPKQEAAVVLDTRHLPVVPVVLVATDCSGVRGPYPDELLLVLVAAEYGRVLRNRSPAGRHRGSG